MAAKKPQEWLVFDPETKDIALVACATPEEAAQMAADGWSFSTTDYRETSTPIRVFAMNDAIEMKPQVVWEAV